MKSGISVQFDIFFSWHPNCATKPKFRKLRLTTYVQRHHKIKRRHACMNTRVLSVYVWWLTRGRNVVTRLSSSSSSFLTCKNTELSYIFIKQKLHVMPDTKWSPLATWDCSKALASRKLSPCTSSWATQGIWLSILVYQERWLEGMY